MTRTTDCGRIARLLPPGPWWYIAVCETHRWQGMSWKHKSEAVRELQHHRKYEASPNGSRGTPQTVPTATAAAKPKGTTSDT